MEEINDKSLSESLEVSAMESEITDIVGDLERSEENDDGDVNNILKDNIDRANRILNKVENVIDNGTLNARLVEAAGLLINSVTNSASQIQTGGYNIKYLQLRKKLVGLKELEIKTKKKLPDGSKEGTGGNKIILTDRETILKFLDNPTNQKEIGEYDDGQ